MLISTEIPALVPFFFFFPVIPNAFQGLWKHTELQCFQRQRTRPLLYGIPGVWIWRGDPASQPAAVGVVQLHTDLSERSVIYDMWKRAH